MYTISRVSTMVGIPAATIRAWEQRHHVVAPARSASGYRVYTEQDVLKLRWLKKQLEERGMSIGEAAMLLQRGDSEEVLAPLARSLSPERSEGSVLVDTMERLYTALLAFQSEEARAMMDMGFSMFGYEKMIGRVLIPLMQKVGDEWHAGRASIAQEHYMTQFVLQRCFSFFHMFPVNHTYPRVLALCPAGEHHHLGLVLFSLYLRQKGIDLLYLGPDTPDEGLDDIIREQGIRIVCLSLTIQDHLPEALKLIHRWHDLFPELTFVLGGKGFVDVEVPSSATILPYGDGNNWRRWFQETIVPLGKKQRRKEE